MKSVSSNKTIWVVLVVLLIAMTSIAIGFTLAKYASEVEVGGFDLSIEQQEQAYALYSATDSSLNFYYGIYPEIGTTLDNGNVVTKVYRNQIATSTAETPAWQDVAASVKSVHFDASFSSVAPVSTKNWFAGFQNAISIDLANLNTTSTTDMSGMFRGCTSLETLQLGEGFGAGVGDALTPEYIALHEVALDWVKDNDEANEITCEQVLSSGAGTYKAMVTYCYATYEEATHTLRIYQRRYVPAVGDTYEGYFVSKVYSWRNGNSGTSYTTCEGGRPPKAAGAVLNSWKNNQTSNICRVIVEDEAQPLTLNSWFRDFSNLGYYEADTSLEILDLRKLDTSKVTDMRYMFYNCNKLMTIDFTEFENFDTSNVTNMSYMFSKCFYLQTLNLSNFNTSSVTTMSNMFNIKSDNYDFKSFLKTIVVSDQFVIGENTTITSMFNFKDASYSILMGGEGTMFDSFNKAYVRIDGGIDAPGYFTSVEQACICETACTENKNSACPRCSIESSNGYNYCKEYVIPSEYNSGGTKQTEVYS